MRPNTGIMKQTKGRSPQLFGRSVDRSLNAAFPCCIKRAPVCLRTDACITLNPQVPGSCVIIQSTDWWQQNSTYPEACYPDRLGRSGKFV